MMELEEIAGRHDIAIIDSSSIQYSAMSNGLPEEMYDKKIEVAIDNKTISCLLSLVEDRIRDFSSIPNLFVINEVVEEIRDYLGIVNQKINFFRRGLFRREHGLPLASKGPNRRQRIYTERDVSYAVDKTEKDNLANLENYAKHLYKLVRVISERRLPIKRTDLLEKIRTIPLPENFFKSEKARERDTDRKIIAKAYELALDGKDVAIITNDTHINDLLFLGFINSRPRIVELPYNGNLTLYAVYGGLSYSPRFNTRVAKENSRGAEMQQLHSLSASGK